MSERNGLRANRTLSKRAIDAKASYDFATTSKFVHPDVMADHGMDEPSSDDSEDETYGKTHAKRKKSGILQLLKQQSLQPMQTLTPCSGAGDASPELDEEFVALPDLKGATPSSMVGRRVTVWYEYDEDAEHAEADDQLDVQPSKTSTAQPTHGLVVYYDFQSGRMFVVFDGDAESDGWWVDGRDEWEWADEKVAGSPPKVHLVPGCWRAGETDETAEAGPASEAAEGTDETVGDIDKIFLVRTAPRAGAESPAVLELYVKWKGLAHVHSQWVPRYVLEVSDAINKRKVARFLTAVRLSLPEGVRLEGEGKKGEGLEQPAGSEHPAASCSGLVANADGLLADGEEAYNPSFNEVEKVIARRHGHSGGAPEWLVKWRGLPYASATWEGCVALLGHQGAIQRWHEQAQTPPTPSELAVAACVPYHPEPSRFRPLATSPLYREGHTLRPHQLEGLNWLLFSWYSRRNVMLADESESCGARTSSR